MRISSSIGAVSELTSIGSVMGPKDIFFCIPAKQGDPTEILKRFELR